MSAIADPAAVDTHLEEERLGELVAPAERVEPVEEDLELLGAAGRDAGRHEAAVAVVRDRRPASGRRRAWRHVWRWTVSWATSQSYDPASVVTFAAACMLTSTSWPAPVSSRCSTATSVATAACSDAVW